MQVNATHVLQVQYECSTDGQVDFTCTGLYSLKINKNRMLQGLLVQNIEALLYMYVRKYFAMQGFYINCNFRNKQEGQKCMYCKFKIQAYPRKW